MIPNRTTLRDTVSDTHRRSYLDTIAKWGNYKLENDTISANEESFLKSEFDFTAGNIRKFIQE